MLSGRAFLPVVVMGVSGSGKTTVRRALAARLSAAGLSAAVPFADADDFHSPASVAKMAAGIALTDDDRWGWLHRTGQWLADQRWGSAAAVVACSALRVAYRDLLRQHVPEVVFVHLVIDLATARGRMAGRHALAGGAEHFMPTSLAESQYATLEPLTRGEHGLTLAADGRLEQTVGTAFQALEAELRAREAGPTGATGSTGRGHVAADAEISRRLGVRPASQ